MMSSVSKVLKDDGARRNAISRAVKSTSSPSADPQSSHDRALSWA